MDNLWITLEITMTNKEFDVYAYKYYRFPLPIGEGKLTEHDMRMFKIMRNMEEQGVSGLPLRFLKWWRGITYEFQKRLTCG